MPEDDGCADVVEDPVACDPEGEGRNIFPHAVVTPGILHIFHNLSWKMDRSMKTSAHGWRACEGCVHCCTTNRTGGCTSSDVCAARRFLHL